MADEIPKLIQNQSLHETVLQILNTPTGETLTPQMLLGLVGLLDLASILDYLHGNGPSPTSPVTLNALNEVQLQRGEPSTTVPQNAANNSNAPLLNTLMSLVGGKNGGKINPSLLPLLLNLLANKPAETTQTTKQDEENKD
jgi:hypothetical protein